MGSLTKGNYTKTIKILMKPPKPKSSNDIGQRLLYYNEHPISKAIIPRDYSQKRLVYYKNQIRIVKNADGNTKSNVKPKQKPMIIHHKLNSFFHCELSHCDIEDEMKATPCFNNMGFNTQDCDKGVKQGNEVKAITRCQSGSNIFKGNKGITIETNKGNDTSINVYNNVKHCVNTPKLMKRHPLLKNMFE